MFIGLARHLFTFKKVHQKIEEIGYGKRCCLLSKELKELEIFYNDFAEVGIKSTEISYGIITISIINSNQI